MSESALRHWLGIWWKQRADERFGTIEKAIDHRIGALFHQARLAL